MQTETEISNNWIICRICLKKSEELFSIFANEDDESLQEKIEKCGGIELNATCELPQQLCKKCLFLLKISWKFRLLCQRSNLEFQSLCASLLPEIEHQTEIEDYNLDEEQQQQEEYDNAGMQDDVPNMQQYFKEEEKSMQSEDWMPMEYTVQDATNDANAMSEELLSMQAEEIEFLYDEPLDVADSNSQNAEEFMENASEISIINVESKAPKSSTAFDQINISITPELKVKKLNGQMKETKKKSDKKVVSNYVCPHCGNLYKTRAKLTVHMKIHSTDKKHKCEICQKQFAEGPQLTRHMNSHTGNRPFKCKYCPACFGDPSTCRKHERIHTNEKPYQCTTCGKSFAYTNVLKVHERTHRGEKPFTCAICGKNFSQLHHKNSHERRHENPYFKGGK